MTWRGIIRDTTPVDPSPGVSELQLNPRMQTANELQRRWGYLSSAIAKQSGPILGIASANGANGNFLTFDVAGSTQGFTGLGPAGIDTFPPQPPGPKARRPIVVVQDPGCAAGGSGTGTVSVADSASFGTCFVSGAISCTANCCYRIQHTIIVTASKTYSGALGPHDDFLYYYDLGTTTTGGASCDAATSSVFAPSVFGGKPSTFSVVVDGYICSNITASLSPLWTFVCTPTSGGSGDRDRYDWSVNISTTVTNVLCAVCHP